MPRKTPLPEREVAICNRLREFREMTQLSRVAFARKAGVDSSLLVRYDFLLTPVRYGPAYKLISTYAINPRWLATGEGQRVSRLAMIDPAACRGMDREPFSAVYDISLGTGIHNKGQGSLLGRAGSFSFNFPDTAVGRSQVYEHLVEFCDDAVLRVPGPALNEFLAAVLEFGYRRILSYPKTPDEVVLDRDVELRLLKMEIERMLALEWAALPPDKRPPSWVDIEKNSSTGLDNVIPQITIDGVAKIVPTTVQDLVERVRVATQPRGARAGLARKLGVQRQVINGWLNQGKLPDAVVTLRLIQWVLQAESQKQSGPGGVTSTAKAKAQRKKISSNANPKTSGPKPR